MSSALIYTFSPKSPWIGPPRHLHSTGSLLVAVVTGHYATILIIIITILHTNNYHYDNEMQEVVSRYVVTAIGIHI